MLKVGSDRGFTGTTRVFLKTVQIVLTFKSLNTLPLGRFIKGRRRAKLTPKLATTCLHRRVLNLNVIFISWFS